MNYFCTRQGLRVGRGETQSSAQCARRSRKFDVVLITDWESLSSKDPNQPKKVSRMAQTGNGREVQIAREATNP